MIQGIMLGIGDWAGLAGETAARAAALTGVEFEVVTRPWMEVPHPSWLKLLAHLEFPHADGWLIMDADMVPLRQWNPRQLLETAGGRLAQALDRPHPAVVAECAEHGLNPANYVNGGLMLYGPQGAEVLELAHRMPRVGRWMEQTVVNLARARMPERSGIIERAFNYVVGPEDLAKAGVLAAAAGAITAHVVGARGNLPLVRACRAEILAAFNAEECA